jgi:ERCC4-related helicase
LADTPSELAELGIPATAWAFLRRPEPYVEATQLGNTRPLLVESTTRQFATALEILRRLTGTRSHSGQAGVLLADDVGLGKTTVAALVAWVFAGCGKRVRIFAPNDVIMRRWRDELVSHVDPLNRLAKGLDVASKKVRVGGREEGRKGSAVKRLAAGSIQVGKFSHLTQGRAINCDLLIVDEAHRARGEDSTFAKRLRRRRQDAARVLILTATPFSIQIRELERMLDLVGWSPNVRAVRGYSRSLADLYTGSTARQAKAMAARLTERASAAVSAIQPYVIRHGVEDLPRERSSFGERCDWPMEIPVATSQEVELLIRMDRALQLAQRHSDEFSQVTNDPRFHVGWRHLDGQVQLLRKSVSMLPEPNRTIVRGHLDEIDRLRRSTSTHSKMRAVCDAVVSKVRDGEKVVLFCHHHATAQELTLCLHENLPPVSLRGAGRSDRWRDAWLELIDVPAGFKNAYLLRGTFCTWLSSEIVRAQCWSWMRSQGLTEGSLADNLQRVRARHIGNKLTVAEAAVQLFSALLKSTSSSRVLRESSSDLTYMAGADNTSRVLGVCPRPDDVDINGPFTRNQQPDTALAIFNSPFGPDVLIATDSLSEGIDLHRYCRHLIHYELDASPIRTVQRNGRLRRVNSWASVTGEPLRCAYPAFKGTRDHRMVQIMRKRVDSFSLLLGGVRESEANSERDTDEQWRSEVLELARAGLLAEGKRLVVDVPA